jgi:hypothetical protein
MRLSSSALAAAFVTTAIAALPAQAAPMRTIIPDAAGGYDERTAAVIPDAAGGYEPAAPEAGLPGIQRVPAGRTLPVAPRSAPAVTPTASDDGVPWVVLALGLAGGTIGITAASMRADARRRAPRARVTV